MASATDLELGPRRVLRIEEPSVGLDAVVVIDHDLFPTAAGGTRMVPDVDEREVARLARAMTWKFAVCGVPYAGAKAGIRFAGGDRDVTLGAYLEAVREWRDFFLTGPDMGTAPEDFIAYGTEGDELPMWARSHDGMGMDDLSVGYGIRGAARVALERLGRSLAGATVAVEGFGKAGAGTARACAQADARIVGVSTIAGALHDPDGLDVDELLRLRAEHGDDLVRHAAGALPREALFEIPCDILVPGARPDAITAATAPRLACAAVVPVANVPYGEGAVQALRARGIVALPDFVTNAGGVHLYESPGCRDGSDPAACLVEIERLIAETTARVLDAADSGRVTPMEAALRLAREFLGAAVSADRGRGQPARK
jgi:glutamate dehydrogenase (NAD(P)+)